MARVCYSAESEKSIKICWMYIFNPKSPMSGPLILANSLLLQPLSSVFPDLKQVRVGWCKRDRCVIPMNVPGWGCGKNGCLAHGSSFGHRRRVKQEPQDLPVIPSQQEPLINPYNADSDSLKHTLWNCLVPKPL